MDTFFIFIAEQSTPWVSEGSRRTAVY